MLEPQSRTLLLDALKPPPDYKLDYAIGTTFTLDLVALLAAPLAFALLDRSGPEGKLSGDPVALLEALRRNADRFAVFCQAGRISVPKPDRLLLSFLEQNVFQVTAPRGGVFHPKVWALRFVADEAPVIYRCICASRNLTFDRSWDVVLTLDGELVDRKNAIAINHPLGDFIAALPGLGTRAVPEVVRQRVEQFQNELRRVDFQLPEDFGGYGFYPLGIGKYKDFLSDERIDRLLVVSPFVSGAALQRVADATDKEVHLISRLEELQTLEPEVLKDIAKVSVFSDEQGAEDVAEEEVGDPQSRESLEPESEPELSGLHAKLYVADQGWNSVVWAGSANATDAAFNRNVEFMVGMIGKKSVVGIDRFLATSDGQIGFASFLKDYVPGTDATAVDKDKRDVKKALDLARLALSVYEMRIQVSSKEGQNTWNLVLLRPEQVPEALPDDLGIQAWPITCRSDSTAKPVRIGESSTTLATFAPLTFEALTSFIAFELRLSRAKAAGRVQFVLNLPVEGFPEDRARRLLLRILDSREAVMRYIQLLLIDQRQAPDTALGAFQPAGGGSGSGGSELRAEPLLEPLVRALHRDPSRLDDVARLVEDLKQAGAGARELPVGFDDIWAPIWEARRRLMDEKPAA